MDSENAHEGMRKSHSDSCAQKNESVQMPSGEIVKHYKSLDGSRLGAMQLEGHIAKLEADLARVKIELDCGHDDSPVCANFVWDARLCRKHVQIAREKAEARLAEATELVRRLKKTHHQGGPHGDWRRIQPCSDELCVAAEAFLAEQEKEMKHEQ